MAAVRAFLADARANVIVPRRTDLVSERYFRNAMPVVLRQNLIDQICAGSGGPCTYTGKSMMEAHTGMNIQAAELAPPAAGELMRMARPGTPGMSESTTFANSAPIAVPISASCAGVSAAATAAAAASSARPSSQRRWSRSASPCKKGVTSSAAPSGPSCRRSQYDSSAC